MGKATPDAVLDATLNDIAEADTLYVCSAEPADFAGIASVALADVALTPGDGNGDFTIADGDSSGRKLTVGAQSDFDVDATGDGDHIVLADASGTTLKYVTTCASQTVTDGNTASTSAWDIEIADPA
jgi:hypothetical protein